MSFTDISGFIDIVCPDDKRIDPFLESCDIVLSSVPLIDIAGSVGSLGGAGGGGVGDGITGVSLGSYISALLYISGVILLTEAKRAALRATYWIGGRSSRSSTSLNLASRCSSISLILTLTSSICELMALICS